MEYWDTSALIKLYVQEPDSLEFVSRATTARRALRTAEFAALEMLCALRRKEQAGDLKQGASDHIFARFEEDVSKGRIVSIPYGSDIWASIRKVVEVAYSGAPAVALRSLDAIHVASALAVNAKTIIATDKRLREAAVRLGLTVFPIESH